MEVSNNNSTRRVLGVFALTMINVAAIFSLRNLPATAAVGWASFFFFALSGLGFFIPCALVSAELATAWPTRGVYSWVKEAFGPHLGFLAIWLQWFANVIWYPVGLSFAAGTLAYLFSPELGENKTYMFIAIIAIYWFCTLLDAFGLKISSFLSSTGVILGTLIPGGFIILLGLAFFFFHDGNQISFSVRSLFPNMGNVQNLATLIAVMLGLAGIEMPAVHAKETENPQRTFPKAIFLSTLLILGISFLGSLAIAFVVPVREMSLVTGTMQAFTLFFANYHILWAVPLLALLMVIGTIGQVGTWVIGPTKGLLQAADDGFIPPLFQKRNSRGMPIALLIMQGVIVTLLCSFFLFMPSINSSYWILTALTSILSLFMYLLLFSAGIRLRYKFPDTPRSYRVPGGKNVGMWLIGLLGFFTCLFAIFVGFFTPEQIGLIDAKTYALLLTIGIVATLAVPFLLALCKKDGWKKSGD